MLVILNQKSLKAKEDNAANLELPLSRGEPLQASATSQLGPSNPKMLVQKSRSIVDILTFLDDTSTDYSLKYDSFPEHGELERRRQNFGDSVDR